MTNDQFLQIFPDCEEPDEWLPLFDHLSEFSINTANQVAIFCAQVGHESMDLNVMSENLNYSVDGLHRVFGKYFRNRDPSLYARNPQKIANLVYANRMGNASEYTGDGWKYRGSGIIQLTGRDNFAAASDYLYSDPNVLLDNPDLVRENKEVAMLCALWYWDKRRLADVDDIEEASRIVNGGTNGLPDRIARYERALSILG